MITYCENIVEDNKKWYRTRLQYPKVHKIQVNFCKHFFCCPVFFGWICIKFKKMSWYWILIIVLVLFYNCIKLQNKSTKFYYSLEINNIKDLYFIYFCSVNFNSSLLGPWRFISEVSLHFPEVLELEPKFHFVNILRKFPSYSCLQRAKRYPLILLPLKTVDFWNYKIERKSLRRKYFQILENFLVVNCKFTNCSCYKNIGYAERNVFYIWH